MNQVILNSITVFRNSLEFPSCIGMIGFNFNERKKRLVVWYICFSFPDLNHLITFSKNLLIGF